MAMISDIENCFFKRALHLKARSSSSISNAAPLLSEESFDIIFFNRKDVCMSQMQYVTAAPLNRAAVLSKAVVRAADALGLSGSDLSAILGVSQATISRMRSGSYSLDEHRKEFELAALFVRFYRSLDAIAGGDEDVRKAWVRGENIALGSVPVDLIKSISGLTDGLAYLDARRAPL